MSWKEKMKEFGGGNFTFLSTDGEAIIFIVVDEPVLLHSKYKGQEQERIGCPVVTDDGYTLFICGKRLARKLSKHEAVFGTSAIMVIRRGVEGDVNAKYEVRVIPDPEVYQRLSQIAAVQVEPATIQESITEASAVLGE